MRPISDGASVDQTGNDNCDVLTCGELGRGALCALLRRFGLALDRVADGDSIPGSYWGAPEAGRIRSQLLVRGDTPVHSALHEACHYICMEPERRDRESIDAGGTALEECGVCYLQVLLAAELEGMEAERMFRDMDRWGYSFRLGSSRAWFERDADDARVFLETRGLVDVTTGRLRMPPVPATR